MHPRLPMTAGLALGISLCLAAPAVARDLKVPRQFSSIQQAVDAAERGDRVVVTRGRYSEDIVVDTDGIVLSGRRAVLQGTVVVNADGVTVERFTFRGGDLQVNGDDAVVRRNRMKWGTLVVDGDDANVVRNRVNQSPSVGAVRVRGERGRISGNKIKRSVCAIIVQGDGATVAGNKILKADEAAVVANADEPVIEDNKVRDVVMQDAIQVRGDDAVVTGNDVDGAPGGVFVEGNDAEITDNELDVGFSDPDSDVGLAEGCPAITVTSDEPGGVIQDNEITHQGGKGIYVEADGATITGNDVDGVGMTADTSMEVIGDDNVVSDNDIDNHTRGAGNWLDGPDPGDDMPEGDGIQVRGDGNVIDDNQVDGVPGDGVDVTGSGNTVADNTVTGADFHGVEIDGRDNVVENNQIRDPAADGIVIDGTDNVLTDNQIQDAGGCGILLQDPATVTGCTIEGCDMGGLVNMSDGSDVTGSSFQSNSPVDVLNLGSFGTFDGNVYGDMSEDPTLMPHDQNGMPHDPNDGIFTEPSPIGRQGAGGRAFPF